MIWVSFMCEKGQDSMHMDLHREDGDEGLREGSERPHHSLSLAEKRSTEESGIVKGYP